MKSICKDCGAELDRHRYARHADGRPVLVCPTHGNRDSLTTEHVALQGTQEVDHG